MTLGALVGEVFKAGATRVAEVSIRRIMGRRAEAARTILLEELRLGQSILPLDVPDVDEFVAILWRYLRAAEEGAARLNLQPHGQHDCRPDTLQRNSRRCFSQWAGVLGSLSQQEIVLIAAILRHQTAIENPARSSDQHQQEVLLKSRHREQSVTQRLVHLVTRHRFCRDRHSRDRHSSLGRPDRLGSVAADRVQHTSDTPASIPRS